MNNKLKPCPFCGGKAFLEKSSRMMVFGSLERCSYVKCINCHARGGRFVLSNYGKSHHSAEASARAVEAWNRRASDE